MSDKCTYDPRPLKGYPIGMFHCPMCGEMVLAGVSHPDYSILDDGDVETDDTETGDNKVRGDNE